MSQVTGAVRDAWIQAGRDAWPAIAVEPDGFVAYVIERAPAGASDDELRAVHAADLWLAAACVCGDAAACAAFDARYLAPLDPVLAATGLAPHQIDDVKQELRKKLLVGDGDRPRLADFSGRADLRTWVRTAAVRAGIDLVRARRDLPADDEELAALPAIADDPELLHLKDRYRGELRDAVTTAIGALAPRERLLLKYHYLDDLGVDPIAAMYGVHRATAARWIVAAREALADRAQRLLIAKLGVTRSELRSIARLVESQLDVSMRRLLQ